MGQSLTNKNIKDTYKGLLKTADNNEITSEVQISDGDGNDTGVYLNTDGSLKATGTVSFGELKDSGEDITVTKFVDEADGIGNNDNDTTIPTSAAVKDYVDTNVTAQDLDFEGDTGTGAVDLDSQLLDIAGGTGITTSAADQTLTIDIDSTVATLSDTQTLTNKSIDLTDNTISGTTAEFNAALSDNDFTTLAGSETLTNKSIDADDNTISNLETDNLKAGVLDTDLSSVSANDDTLASAKAIKTYVDTQITAEDLDFSGDTGSGSVDLDSQTFAITGANGISTSGANQGLVVDGSTLQSSINTNANNISTNATNIASNDSDISTLQTDVGTNSTNIANNGQDIATNTTNISANATNIASNDTDISALQSDVSTNTNNISTNATNIASNNTDIATNASNISTNTSNISTNTSNISTNTSDIATNTTNISANATNITSNDTDIATNAGNISTNTSNISTNTSNISTNTSNISANAGNIQTNADDIADLQTDVSSNTTAIAGKVARAGDSMSGKLNVNYQDAEIEIRNNSFSGSRSKLTFGTTMSSDQASVQLNNSSSNLEFRRGVQSSAPKMTIQSSAVYFSSPLRIGDDDAANELDDYEEGTYNLKFYLGTNSTAYDGNNGFSTFTNNSKYVKVGRKVTLYIKLQYTGVSNAIQLSSSRISLGNFPFTPVGTEYIGGTYGFNYLERAGTTTIPAEYGWNGVIQPSFFGASFSGKAQFQRIEFIGAISSWAQQGIYGTMFPRSGPFGSTNYLVGIINYYTND